MKRLVAPMVLLSPLWANAQAFEQGPGAIGAQRALVGKVIGLDDSCALVLAANGWPG